MALPPVSESAPGSPPARRRPIRSVSLLIPTYQGAEFLGRLLASLRGQRGAPPFDVLAIDSGSTDGTLEVLAAAAADFPVPLRVRHIHAAEFDHGDTRNRLAAASAGDLLVFLTQDAIPAADDWLATLVANFDDPRVGAAYCRNAPRADARPATRILSAEDPGYSTERREVALPADWRTLDAHALRVLYNFNDVASALPRELWERHPFPRTAFGEDVLLARALLHAGFKVVYDADAVVEHSHDYDARETLGRARIDGRFNAEWLDRICFRSQKEVEQLCRRFEEADRRAVAAAVPQASERPAVEREVAARRRAAFTGLLEGGASPRRFGATRLLAGGPMRILLCVHGFPPDTWAGTEVYTLELARALQARGHQCTILTRSPGEPGQAEFSVHEDEFEGLRVLRLVHRLQHASLEESWSKPAVEDAFRSVLSDVQPELVHFQHLIHLSIGCVAVARDLGLATVLHCHDYWALCARVQLIRPDGVRCETSMGAGCLLCVKEREYEQIPRARKLGTFARPLLERFARRAHRAPADSPVRRRWEGLLDMVDRPRAVLGAYAAADLLVSPSRFLREKLLASGAFDRDRFVFSDNGLRTDRLAALEKRPDPRGRLRVAFIGTLAWYKGGETLIRAMQRLRGERLVLDVYGAFDPDSDPHHAELQQLAGDNVTFRGRFDNSRLSEVYTEIDVLVVPSIWFENSPITIHEAYLAGTPVVASDLGGMAEFVRDGVDGLLFEPGSDEDLARVLLRLLREPGLVDALSRDFMEIKSIEENAIETEYRYRALLARRAERLALPLLERRGHATDAQSGPAETQGADLLLMRPGSVAEYRFSSLAGRDVRVEIELLALAAEPALELGGRVLLDGRPLGEIPAFTSEGRDRTVSSTFRGRVEPGAASLTLEPRLGPSGPEHHLRVARVRVCDAEAAR